MKLTASTPTDQRNQCGLMNLALVTRLDIVARSGPDDVCSRRPRQMEDGNGRARTGTRMLTPHLAAESAVREVPCTDDSCTIWVVIGGYCGVEG